jgi:tellurite resistance protein TehA-like permease
MEPTLNPDELRELFLSIAEPETARALALGGSLLLVVVVLWLVRRRSLREEFTPIWMAVAFALAVLSVRLDWLRWLTRAVGAWTPSSVIFFLGEVFLVVVCLNYAVRLSKAGVEIKNLAQEVALLRTRLDRIEPSADAEL